MVHPAVLGARFSKALFQAAGARVAGRPRRAGWSVMEETVFRFMKEDANRVQALDWAAVRAHQESMVQKSAVAGQVTSSPVQHGGVPCLEVVPRETTKLTGTLVYFHGGSYLYGSTRTHFDLTARLALAAGTRVLSVDYRLAPEHPFPAALEDAQRVLQALPPGPFVVGGDSAGGGLSLAVALARRDAGAPLPDGLLLICPWVDLGARGGSLEANAVYDWAEPWMFERWAKAVAGNLDVRDPRLSPLCASLQGLPQTLILAGSAEMLLDQEQALAQKARAAGVDVTLEVTPDMVHNWLMFASLFPRAQQTVERAGAFVRQRLR